MGCEVPEHPREARHALGVPAVLRGRVRGRDSRVRGRVGGEGGRVGREGG